MILLIFFFQAEDGIRDGHVTGVQTCALPIWLKQQGKVVQVPAGFEITAEAEHWPVLGMSDTERNLYGVHFHPELNKTPRSEERRVGKECKTRRWQEDTIEEDW